MQRTPKPYISEQMPTPLAISEMATLVSGLHFCASFHFTSFISLLEIIEV